MTFKDMLDSDLDIFFNEDEFAESASYKPKVGDAISITVLADVLDEARLVASGIGQGQYDTANFEIRADQVTPKMMDVITFRGKDWTIRKVQNVRDGRTYQVFATTSERAKL